VSQKESLLMLEQFNDWSTHPVTLALRRHLQNQLQSLKDQWSNGNFTASTAEATALLSANAVGQCEVLNQLLSIEQDQLFPGANE